MLSNCDQIAERMAIRLMLTVDPWFVKDPNDAARMRSTEDIRKVVSVNLDADPRSSPKSPVDRYLWEIVPVADSWVVGTVLFLLWPGYVQRSVLTPVLIGLGRWAGKCESSTPYSMAVMRRRTR